MTPLGEEVIRKIEAFNAQDVANSLWALAHLQSATDGSPALTEALAKQAGVKLDDFKAQEISTTIRSLLKMGAVLDPSWPITQAKAKICELAAQGGFDVSQ